MTAFVDKVQRSATPDELGHLAAYARKVAGLGEVHTASIVFTSLECKDALLGEVWFDGTDWRVDFQDAGKVPGRPA